MPVSLHLFRRLTEVCVTVKKNHIIFLHLVILLLCAQARASVYGGCLRACSVLEEALAQAKADPNLREAALRLLRATAEGRAAEVDAEMLQSFQILDESINAEEMNSESARVAAFLAIGKLGSPAAREYLEIIKKEQFSEAEREPLWQSVLLARHEWILTTLPDMKRRVDFLVSLLRARRENVWIWAPEGWALDQLCSIGDINALPELEAAIQRNVDMSQRSQSLRLCRDIAYLVSSQRDRVAALSAALRIDEAGLNEPLLHWAISELGQMRTRESRAALEKFVENAMARRGTRATGDPVADAVQSARLYLMRWTK